MSSPRKKIPLTESQPPLASPFAALSSEGLPEGAAVPATISSPGAPAKARKRPKVILRREKARRGGKTVIVISQLPSHLSPPEIEALMQAAKKALGCGGSVEGREIELQGDQAERVRHFLESRDFAVEGI